MLNVQIDNRDGTLWELPVSELTYKTSRIGKASSIEFSFNKDGIYQDITFKINNGDIVRVLFDDMPVFYGYIFKVDEERDGPLKVIAYDQLRYLMYTDTYVFKNASATEIIMKIAADSGLKSGQFADTVYKIPKTVEDGVKLMDIACNALAKTTIATNKIFVLFDDFGELTLRDAAEWKLDISIGDVSLAYSYKLSRSIDSDTYNRIKVVQDNKTTGKRDVYIAQDSTNIANWGRLQLYQKVDDKMNAGQINEILNRLIEAKNRESRTFSVEAIGDVHVRAGCYLSINIDALSVNQYFLVEECTHKFDGDDHTMSIELRVFG